MFDFNGNLIVIRHAPTAENKQGVCLGRLENIPFEVEVEKVCELVKNEPSLNGISFIISSSLNRARVTAERINNFLKAGNFIIDPRFNDLDFGWFCGKDPKLIQEVQPEIYDHRKFFKYDIALKEGESLEMLEKRVRKGLNELLLLS